MDYRCSIVVDRTIYFQIERQTRVNLIYKWDLLPWDQVKTNLKRGTRTQIQGRHFKVVGMQMTWGASCHYELVWLSTRCTNTESIHGVSMYCACNTLLSLFAFCSIGFNRSTICTSFCNNWGNSTPKKSFEMKHATFVWVFGNKREHTVMCVHYGQKPTYRSLMFGF